MNLMLGVFQFVVNVHEGVVRVCWGFMCLVGCFFLRWQLAENGTFTLFTQSDRRKMHTGTKAKEVSSTTMSCPLLTEELAPQPLIAAEEPTQMSQSSCKTLEQIKTGAQIFSILLLTVLTKLWSSRKTWSQLERRITGQVWKSQAGTPETVLYLLLEA